MKRGGEWKMKIIRKVWCNNDNKIFLLLIVIYGKGYILLENIVWENAGYAIIFLVKFLLVLHDIWNEVMKH